MMNWWQGITAAVRTLAEILSAGISITAFALLLYAFTFNLKDRVARAFTLILICVVIVFTGDALSSSATLSINVTIWLKIQWLGIIFLPPTYMQFSDALLATTGKPSRGKRSWATRITYVASAVFVGLLAGDWLLGPLVEGAHSAEYLSRTIFTDLFSLYYGFSMIASWINFTRAYRRTTTTTAKRRMFYLITGALAPALGSFPYLLYVYGLAADHSLLFWLIVLITNLIVGGLIVMMAYSIAFFGVDWPDRVVKRRLFKWILRGPVTAITALGITTLVKKGSLFFGLDYQVLVPIMMALSILLMEFTITILSPLIERWLFYSNDRQEIDQVTALSDRLMTRNDLRQFLEAILSAASDRFQAKSAFIGAFEAGSLSMIVSVGETVDFENDSIGIADLPVVESGDWESAIFQWRGYHVIPLIDNGTVKGEILGILGLARPGSQELDHEERDVLGRLSARVILALVNRKLQQEVFRKAGELNPQFEQFQKMRADSRFANLETLTEMDYEVPQDLVNYVRDALTHFWGGPKLAGSPLLKLNIIRQSVDGDDANPTNALRGVLRQAIEKVRPDGERKTTGEWILYNILEMKFIQGKKVREVAIKLAMSEADLYRKQRVAIEAVARVIMEMESSHKNGA